MDSTFNLSLRIDFHSNVSNQHDYACRLVRKALVAQFKLVVRLQDETQLKQFDELLWKFSATDFLPHVVFRKDNLALAQHTPVILIQACDKDAVPFLSKANMPRNEILINLSDTVPDHFVQFERLIEIVPKEEKLTQAGRERYRFYQQQGYQLNHIIAK